LITTFKKKESILDSEQGGEGETDGFSITDIPNGIPPFFKPVLAALGPFLEPLLKRRSHPAARPKLVDLAVSSIELLRGPSERRDGVFETGEGISERWDG
jgi:hypothetical protein